MFSRVGGFVKQSGGYVEQNRGGGVVEQSGNRNRKNRSQLNKRTVAT